HPARGRSPERRALHRAHGEESPCQHRRRREDAREGNEVRRREGLTRFVGIPCDGSAARCRRRSIVVAPSSPTMTQKSDGMNYAPQGKPRPVVQPGEFVFAAAYLEHGHIYGQCNGLIEAGAQLKWVYDSDPDKVSRFVARYPQAKAARSYDEILADPEVKLVAAAAIPIERGPIGIRTMDAGKDYFTDKTPFTTLAQLDEARAAVARTGRKYMVYFSERLHVESAMFATDLVAGGAIGRVLQVIGLGPHRLNKP